MHCLTFVTYFKLILETKIIYADGLKQIWIEPHWLIFLNILDQSYKPEQFLYAVVK